MIRTDNTWWGKKQTKREDGVADVADKLLYVHAKTPYCQWDFNVKWRHGH